MVARVFSARGAGREWNSLDRLERWLKENGFWYWWTRNDLEPLGPDAIESKEVKTVAAPPISPIPPYVPPVGLNEAIDDSGDT